MGRKQKEITSFSWLSELLLCQYPFAIIVVVKDKECMNEIRNAVGIICLFWRHE